jgi:hypothetical protein
MWEGLTFHLLLVPSFIEKPAANASDLIFFVDSRRREEEHRAECRG